MSSDQALHLLLQIYDFKESVWQKRSEMENAREASICLCKRISDCRITRKLFLKVYFYS
ncbi:MAG: hypothetical protein FD166_406 [Bacteroidetes bacterium]|nr:MAG: hypothetical protein FD166_406 [Bacteroidota bacterium]